MRKVELIRKKMFLSFFAFVLGAILPLAFAPFEYYPIAFFCLASLLFLWSNAGKNTLTNESLVGTKLNNNQLAKNNALYGFYFGLGFFGFSVYWVYISIHNFGNASSILAIGITLLFILYLSLFPALQGYLVTKFFPHNNLRKLLLVFPSSWVLLELFRGWLFTGFPWMYLGYSQIDAPLRGFAPIFGVYGVSFLTVFTAAAVVGFFMTKEVFKRTSIAVLTLFIWFSGFVLAKIDWTKQSGKELTVSLIQANVPQELKWQLLERNSILKKYVDFTKQNLSSDIIVWPEAAIPAFQNQVDNYLLHMGKLAKDNNITIISGIPIIEHENSAVENYFNGMISFGNDNNKYLKRHLVPFGEFVPLKFWFGNFMDYFSIPMSDFASGHDNQPDFLINKTIIAPFICYEIAYPNLVLSYFPKAGLIVTISDDSWFGKSLALAQHLEIARMRSLETGRYQLVVANTGLTAIVDSFGKVVAQAPAFKDFALDGKVQIRTGATFWVCYGHYLWILLIILCLVFAIIG